jgi:NAD(P)-dependent dehydrogenase (short-subunit alcohol dehydrogenase family)
MMPRIWPIEMLPVEDMSQCLHVNVVGTFNCLQNELKNMRKGGSIVNCGSQLSGYSSAGVSAYSAAKHAIVGLTKVAAYEGAAKGIRVNTLSP